MVVELGLFDLERRRKGGFGVSDFIYLRGYDGEEGVKM